jgi:hypothetical protein
MGKNSTFQVLKALKTRFLADLNGQKSCFKAIFTHVLGLQTNRYKREQLLFL